MTDIIYNPIVPYVGHIPGGLYPGRAIRIRGVTHDDDDRFAINLQRGGLETSNPDIGLHFNPRFDEPMPVVVRNTFINGEWGPEERHGPFPFFDDQPFEVLIVCGDAAFKVFVDGQEFIQFQFRMPLNVLTHIGIRDDITVHSIGFEGGVSGAPGWAAQSGAPPAYSAPYSTQPAYGGGYPGSQGDIIQNPPIPFNNPIPGGLHPSRMIIIRGTPHGNADRFVVNLQSGPSIGGPYGNVPLHFNPRFDEGLVVRNTFSDGDWEDEERGGGFPFVRGQPFELMILSETDHFKIAVNGQHFVEYRYRLPLPSVTHLAIQRDVSIESIRVTN